MATDRGPNYTRKKQKARERERALVLAGQDIAPCPPPRNLSRRSRADASFRAFCETYFSKLFSLAWSDDHLRVIEKIERVVNENETFAVAMPRGSGKTTLCQVAVLWAILTGKHPFVFLVASTEEYALAMLSNIKSHLALNDLLFEDYPEAVYPIRSLENEARRAAGQRYYGRLTHIGWSADEIVFATIPGSRCSGAIIRVAGITGNIRGALYIRPDGSSVRPTLAIIDDPQTDQSAKSLSQTHERMNVVSGAIAGLAGPGKRTAMIMPCTVIKAGDLADQILDRVRNPHWQGERTKLIYEFPTNAALWEQYEKILNDNLRDGGRGKPATEFYKNNRAAMDEGARVAWLARYEPGEISAIQHAMNLKLRGGLTFWAEYQNEPFPEKNAEDEGLLSADQIAAKVNGIERGVIPLACSHLSMFIDVQAKVLFWAVCAWSDDFGGAVVEYGTFPDQRAHYFTLREARYTLADSFKNAAEDGQIIAGLEHVIGQQLAKEYRREDGTPMRIGLCLVDANWKTEHIYTLCRQSAFGALLLPSRGRYVGASSRPFSEYKQEPGIRTGLNWRIVPSKVRAARHVLFDTNFWKSFVHARLVTSAGDRGSFSLFGRSSHEHRLLAEHLTAEYRVKTTGRERSVDEWKMRAGATDNHWLDCVVGCAVGGSILGAKFNVGQGNPQEKKRGKRYTAEQLAALYRGRHA